MADQHNKGHDNLIPLNKRTKEEQRIITSKGGKASQEKQRQRKTLKEELLLLLNTDAWQENITLSLLKQAEEGNVKAFEVIRDTVGEKHVEKIDMTASVSTNKLDDILNEIK